MQTKKFFKKISYFSRNKADQLQSNLVRPRQRHELIPPSGHDLRHVEPRQEGDGDQVGEPAGVHAQHLEHLPVEGVVEQHVAVQQTEEGVGQEEEREVVPDQLEDAPLPDEQHVPDAIELLCRVLV